MSYAEAETILVAAAASEFTSARVCTETPENLADVLPVIRIKRFSGTADSIYTFDNPEVDFDCYGADYASAQTLAYEVRTWLRSIVGTSTGGAFIARVQDRQGPIWTPYDNTNVRRFTYSAVIRLHSLGV